MHSNTSAQLLRLIKKHPEYTTRQLADELSQTVDYIRGTLSRLRRSGATDHRVPTKYEFTGEYTKAAKAQRKRVRVSKAKPKVSFLGEPQFGGNRYSSAGYLKLI